MKEKEVKETEDKPKAVIAMEENSDVGKEKKRQEEEKKKQIKKSNKKFVIKYIIFIIILAILTAVAIYYSIEYLYKNEEEIIEEIKEAPVTKPTAIDSKYAVKSYSETYNENSIKITSYDENNSKAASNQVGKYIQIEGLLDKTIEEKINNKLKQTADELSKNGRLHTYSYCNANFGNVLSVLITNNDGEVRTHNINLATGEEIKLEDVFVSSAPLNSYITEGVFKHLAWEQLGYDYEINEGFLDLDKVDTSNYEDIALQTVNKYKNKNDNISFCISTSEIRIFDLIGNDSYEFRNSIDIDFLEHKDEVAIYKRFLTDNSIFENDSIGEKGIVVFTEKNSSMENLIYGKIEENIFMEEVLMDWVKEEDIDKSARNKIQQYLNNIVESDKQNVRNKVTANQGIFYQKELCLGNADDYYSLSIWEYEASCDYEYFKDGAFKDYIVMKASPRADVGLNGFSDYYSGEFKNLHLSEAKYSILYFDKEGNFLKTKIEKNENRIQQEEEGSIIQEVIEEDNNI